MDKKTEQDDSHFKKSFRYEQWINTWPLNIRTVMEYFKYSDFYDRTCNNEQVAMQRNADQSQLKKMEGVQYELDRSQGKDENTRYFLIKKLYRTQPKENSPVQVSKVHLLNLYYVVGVDPPLNSNAPPRGTIFPLPDLHSVVNTNLRTSCYYLQSAIEELSKHCKYDLGGVYSFDFSEEEEDSGPSTSGASGLTTSNVATQSASDNALVDELLKKLTRGELDH